MTAVGDISSSSVQIKSIFLSVKKIFSTSKEGFAVEGKMAQFFQFSQHESCKT